MARTRRYSIEIRNTPYAGATEAWEVGAAVGNVKNNRPELMERVGLL
jgi:putative SOS response-associated peptidase YedK